METAEIKEECKNSGDLKVKEENSSGVVYEVEITSKVKPKIKPKNEDPTQSPTTLVTDEKIKNAIDTTIKSDQDPLTSVVYEVEVASKLDIEAKEEDPSQNHTTSVTNEKNQDAIDITLKSDQDSLSSVVYEVEATSKLDFKAKEEDPPQSPPTSVTNEEIRNDIDITVNPDQDPPSDELEIEPESKNTSDGESESDSNEQHLQEIPTPGSQARSIKKNQNMPKREKRSVKIASKKCELLECTLCPQSFARMGRLITHARNEHATINYKIPSSESTSDDEDKASSQCPLCSKSLASFRCLQNHFRLFHIKNKPFQCSVCLESKNEIKKFPTITVLKRHIARVHNPARFKFKCNNCPMKFQNLQECENHKETHLEKKYKCEYCSNGFRKKERVLRHIIAVHKEYTDRHETFKCDECEQLFCSKKDLKFHDLQTHVKDTVQCKICFKKFREKGELSIHLSVSHRENRTWLVCDVCSKVFKNNKELIQHLEVEHERFFKCRKCFRSFECKEDYEGHSTEILDKKGRNVKRSQLQCNVCLVFLKTECAFSTHKDTHLKTGEIGSKIVLPLQQGVVQEHFIKCDFCPKTFFQKALLLKHASECHPHQKWECKSCEKSFQLKYQLVEHELLHSTRKPFTCKVCFKSFTVHSYLMTHLEIHKKVKKYKCSQCIKSFASSLCLRLHMANHHGAEKPFKCDGCQKAFAAKSSLGGHLRSHPLEGPFGCKKCAHRYKSAQQLRSHQQKDHQKNSTAGKSGGKFTQYPARHGPHLKYFDDMVFVCVLKDCNFETKDEKEVAIHNEMHGLPVLILSQELPSRTFVKGTLKVHSSTLGSAERIKSRTVQPRFKCRYCFKVYRLSHTLHKHMKHFHRNAHLGSLSVHSTTRHDDFTKNVNPVHHGPQSKYDENLVFVCSVTECNFETKDEKEVAIHYSKHYLPKVNVPRLLYSPSGQVFLSKSATMNKHMIQARYKCKKCLKTMSYPDSLRKHIMTFHDDKKN